MRIASYILSSFVFLAATLPVVSLHFCHEELADWALYDSADPNCHQEEQAHSCCGDEHREDHSSCGKDKHKHHEDECNGKDGCCDDLTVSADLDLDVFHQQAMVLKLVAAEVPVLPVIPQMRAGAKANQGEAFLAFSDLPPPDRVTLFQKFQFYG